MGSINNGFKSKNDFKQKEQPQVPIPMAMPEPEFTRYKVNALIDNSELEGAL